MTNALLPQPIAWNSFRHNVGERGVAPSCKTIHGIDPAVDAIFDSTPKSRMDRESPKTRKRNSPTLQLTFDVGLIRTDAPEGTRFLVLRVRPLRHHARIRYSRDCEPRFSSDRLAARSLLPQLFFPQSLQAFVKFLGPAVVQMETASRRPGREPWSLLIGRHPTLMRSLRPIPGMFDPATVLKLESPSPTFGSSGPARRTVPLRKTGGSAAAEPGDGFKGADGHALGLHNVIHRDPIVGDSIR